MPQTPVVGETFTFPVCLRPKSDARVFQTAPTITADDFRISINGGVATALDNTPTVTPAGWQAVRIIVSAAETTEAGAGGDILVVWEDDVGDQWCSDYAVLKVAAREIDDLAAPGDEMDLVAGAVDAAALAVSALAAFFNTDSGETGAGAVAGSVVYEILDNVNTVAFPAGGITYTYTLTSAATGLPIPGAEIWFSTDAAGVNIVWKGNTDTFGVARDVNNNLPRLDAGTYFIHRLHPEFTFDDPDSEVVS